MSTTRANLLAGEWRPARRGARFESGPPDAAEAWPQSGPEDVAEARRALGGAGVVGDGVDVRAALRATAAVLERDADVLAEVARRFALAPGALARHVAGLTDALEEELALPVRPDPGLAWHASHWSELVRGPLLDLARSVRAGRAVALLSDERVPVLAAALADAARASGLRGVALLHGRRRELLAHALRPGDALVASGTVEHMVELRRAHDGGAHDRTRLRALRAGVAAVAAGDDLEARASEVVDAAFGGARTLAGQLPGALARVHCAERVFSRFQELLLEALERADPPVAQVDALAAQRARAAWELGLDEGATCIAGGEAEVGSERVPATVLTNVERRMRCARRQDPLPVLCLLRT